MLRTGDVEQAIRRAAIKRDLKDRLARSFGTPAERRAMLLELLGDNEAEMPADTEVAPVVQSSPSLKIASIVETPKLTQRVIGFLRDRKNEGVTTNEIGMAFYPTVTPPRKQSMRARGTMRWLQDSGRAALRDGKWYLTENAETQEAKNHHRLPERLVVLVSKRNGTASSSEIVYDLKTTTTDEVNKTHVYNTLSRLVARGRLMKSERDGKTVYVLPNGGAH